jgi:transcriptional regulator GlxA family with amidase domain
MRRHRVVVLALDGVMPFELAIAGRVFGSAEDLAGRALYEVATCTVDGRPVRTDADFTIAVDHDATLVRHADTLVVPAPTGRGPLFESGYLAPAVGDAIALRPRRTRLVSICIGAFVLAAAGLLDGRRATTHWQRAAEFQTLFPHVQLDPGVLFVDDGDLLTSAGVAAGLDLCLHLVRRDHGSDVANRVARLCIVPAWREGGQAQYIERPLPPTVVASTAATRAWALTQLNQPLSLVELANHAHMSERTFTRRFRQELGTSPARWLMRQRIDRVRTLLESTSLPIERVADEAGFGTSASMRQHLRAELGISPTSYRQTFQAAGFVAPSDMGRDEIAGRAPLSTRERSL